MTGHFLSDIILVGVGLIVFTWIFSALFGWIYFAWMMLPGPAVNLLKSMFRRST